MTQLSSELLAKLHIELLVLLLIEEPEISWMLIGVSKGTVTCWFFKNGPLLTFARPGLCALVIAAV